mmetsp:Transcript_6073/g.17018  ORF Transcript_6073/g.17018 Transcript_6073/m.17018 type:complete len:253 (-) Transcript_6073:1153-1911(-)
MPSPPFRLSWRSPGRPPAPRKISTFSAGAAAPHRSFAMGPTLAPLRMAALLVAAVYRSKIRGHHHSFKILVLLPSVSRRSVLRHMSLDLPPPVPVRTPPSVPRPTTRRFGPRPFQLPVAAAIPGPHRLVKFRALELPPMDISGRGVPTSTISISVMPKPHPICICRTSVRPPFACHRRSPRSTTCSRAVWMQISSCRSLGRRHMHRFPSVPVPSRWRPPSSRRLRPSPSLESPSPRTSSTRGSKRLCLLVLL